MVSVTPQPRFAPGKGTPVPIIQEAGWASEPVWTHRLEEKSFAPAGDRTPIARSSDTILPELTRLPIFHEYNSISYVVCKCLNSATFSNDMLAASVSRLGKPSVAVDVTFQHWDWSALSRARTDTCVAGHELIIIITQGILEEARDR
jgi:hypothetical protein